VDQVADFNCYRFIGNYQKHEMLDHTAAQVLLAIESGDSIRCVAQHLHTPYETVRQAVNRLEDAGYVTYDEGLQSSTSTSATLLASRRCQRRRQSTLHRGGLRHPTVR